MNEKSHSPQLLLPPPESFFVFVVGHCEEWPEDRDEQGDTAIYKEYLDFGVPEDQCVYIKDSDCTRKNCQEKLEIFLGQKSSLSSTESGGTKLEEKCFPNTLVFYYGGHGSANGFATIGGTWGYRQVAQTIQELFHGERILFLLDCCAAGNLWQYLPSPSSVTNITAKKQYALLASSMPYITSSSEGEEWILNNMWIQCMRRRSATNQGSDNHFELEKIISLLADRTVFKLGDLFFAYCTTMPLKNSPCEISNSWSWMPARCRRKGQTSNQPASLLPSLQAWLSPSESISSSGDLYRMPRQAKILSTHDCRVGDAVAYKHPGGYPLRLVSSESIPSSSRLTMPFYVPPLWLNGTIVSIFENDRDRKEAETKNGDRDYSNILFQIRVWYPSQMEPWETVISPRSPHLINHYFVAQSWMLPRSFLETQVMLAKKYRQYLDCSLAANTPVRVFPRQVVDNNDDEALEGTILDWKDFNWKRLHHSCNSTFPGTTGYDEYYWNELPVQTKTAALAFGYTKSSWDNDTEIPADKMNWDELSGVQKDAASVLGYIRPKSATPSTDSNDSDDLNLNNGMASFLKQVSEISTCSGPHVPVEWNRNHKSSLVPLKHIVFPNAGRNFVSLNKTKETMTTPISSLTTTIADDEKGVEYLQRQSLIRGLESSGKSIGNAASIFGTTELSAFWIDDETWWDATPIDIGCHDNNISSSNNKLLLDLLATHFEYTLSGVYCPMEYEDGERSLIPLNYIFKRGCQPQQKEEGDSEELQRQSLIRGLESSGKSIGNAASLFGTKELSAFWLDDETWWDAIPIDIVWHDENISQNNNKLTLDLLETHLEYTLPGVYCPIEYEDGVRHLIPLSYIFKRGCQPQQKEGGGDSDNMSDAESSTSTSKFPTEEAIDEITKSLLRISLKASSFGKEFSEAACKIEEASKLFRASFEMSMVNQSREQDEGNTDRSSSVPATSRSTEGTVQRPSRTKSYLDDYWSDLPKRIKIAAERIGYNKKLWDSDGQIPIDLKEWKDLTSNEEKDLKIIGYNETKWRSKDDSDSSDSSDNDY